MISYENPQSFLEINARLSRASVQERVSFALENLPGNFALASSFGAQSAVSLHALTQIYPDIPVMVIDTGYLFKETYQFIDELTERLSLNLKVYRADLSPAWQEARYGLQWQDDVTELNQYNQRNKVEPMERALTDLNVGTWFAGLRRSQSQSRKSIEIVQPFKGRIKVHPIADWNNQQMHQYLTRHNLPYHPLWHQGYVSIGDHHSTVPLSANMLEEDTRFGGRQRECGLHLDAEPMLKSVTR